MLKLRNRVLRLENVHICVVPPCYVVDILILRNYVFRLRKVQISVALSRKVVVLLIFRNSVSKLQKGSDMDCVELQGGFADVHELWFQGAKR